MLRDRYHCKNCNLTVYPIPKRRGNTLLQVILFLFFIIPGIIYTIWRLGGYKIVCPRCKKSNLVEMATKEKPKVATFPEQKTVPKGAKEPKKRQPQPASKDAGAAEQSPTACPSVEEFLKYYNKGDYYKAIGVFRNAGPQEIRDAIDMFEVEHADRPSEWGIPLSKIREALLKVGKEETNEREKKEAIRIDHSQRRNAEFIMAEADRLFDLGQLDKALKKCDEAINIDPHLGRAYSKRGHIHRVIAYAPESAKSHIELAIKDYDKAIEIEPESGELYMSRGACYAQKGEIERSIPNYGRALGLNPSNTFAALGKLEAEICLGRYNDAVGTYGAWRRDATSPKDQVIGSSLICIALALQGKPYEEYITPLYDHTVKLSENHDWCIVEIDRHLAELEKQGFASDRVTRAKKIQALFKGHFE